MTPSAKLEVKRRPGSSMFMDTHSSLVSPASILLAIFFLDGRGRIPVFPRGSITNWGTEAHRIAEDGRDSDLALSRNMEHKKSVAFFESQFQRQVQDQGICAEPVRDLGARLRQRLSPQSWMRAWQPELGGGSTWLPRLSGRCEPDSGGTNQERR
jgi:hypothetical protein